MLSIVIPSYNRRDCVLNLLRDVFAQEGADFEVIVVDDCSPDDSVEAIRREFPQVRLFVNEKNGGPCVTRNRGIREATGDWIVGFDSDVTLPDRELLSKVRSAITSHPKATGFAFRIFKADGITDDAPRWWHPVSLDKGGKRVFESDYFSGTAYAFRRSDMIAAGLFPEILYMHYEEVELAYRILDAGGSILYLPCLTVVHHANEVSRRSEIQVFYKPRNQILLAMSCFPPAHKVVYLAPRLAFQLFKSLKNAHFNGFCRAMKDAMAKRKQLPYPRKPLKPSTLLRIARLRRDPA